MLKMIEKIISNWFIKMLNFYTICGYTKDFGIFEIITWILGSSWVACIAFDWVEVLLWYWIQLTKISFLWKSDWIFLHISLVFTSIFLTSNRFNPNKILQEMPMLVLIWLKFLFHSNTQTRVCLEAMLIMLSSTNEL